ncbi:hypothetical protein [Streptomyces sp. OK228]|uniref:hypothetical protein n=1 Tax=Streptomyces sp. OK228 TaxID=1882786 RepID=UPI000BDBEA5E|nr:hypothetical protein [Streptomyces sp. OK228]SOE31717.1 hypothetical protein SAMN05442782_8647 [Streptomyces sp. OK228]
MTDRETLDGLLGEWVTVRNPDLPVSWYGRLVGLHDDPGVLLAIPGRGGTCLPQRYTIAAAEAPAAVPAAQGRGGARRGCHRLPRRLVCDTCALPFTGLTGDVRSVQLRTSERTGGGGRRT